MKARVTIKKDFTIKKYKLFCEYFGLNQNNYTSLIKFRKFCEDLFKIKEGI